MATEMGALMMISESQVTLFIVHGWAYDLKPWSKTVKCLQQSGIKVVQLKVPGLTRPSQEVFTIDDYVEWFKRQINNVEKPVVLGHSNGGRIILNYLQKYPNSLGHLILLNSAGIPDRRGVVAMKRHLLKLVSKIGKPLSRVDIIGRVYYRIIGAGDYGRAPDNMKQTLQNMLISDSNLRISPQDFPVDVIWGQNDKITRLGMGQEIAKSIESKSFRVIEGAGHSPYISSPEALCREIMDILS